jgi:hypothetical protein
MKSRDVSNRNIRVSRASIADASRDRKNDVKSLTFILIVFPSPTDCYLR